MQDEQRLHDQYVQDFDVTDIDIIYMSQNWASEYYK